MFFFVCVYILLTGLKFLADELVDRNCECCVTCCIDYEGWLQFQNCLYGIVKDPLFELFITTCIVLNTLFLALEHHGMSENVRSALDIGNKVPNQLFAVDIRKYYDGFFHLMKKILLNHYD